MVPAPRVPSEMISGPDLGGGYLHQLSVDQLESIPRFVHHAQAGGRDGGGPPVGALDVLGFVHPPAPCMFGGPRCWHRSYQLPLAAATRVRTAYQRHRFVLEAMLRQAYGLSEVPFDEVLDELLRKVAGPLREEGIEWYLVNSAAVRLAGGGGSPRDLDLGTTRAGVVRLGELLAEYLIEPVAPTDWPGGRAVSGGRAFVGTPRAGARVEWAVPLEPAVPLPGEELAGLRGVARTLEINVRGGETVRVSRPEYALLRAAVRKRSEATEAALAAIRAVGVDVDLLDLLLRRSSLPAPLRASLRASALG